MKFLIDFKNEVSQADIDAYFIKNKCSLEKEFSNYDKVYLVSCAKVPPVTKIVECVINDEASPIQLLGVSHDLPTTEFGNIVMDNPSNWWKVASILSPNFDVVVDQYPIYGKGVTVYMVDSGIDLTHPEFDGVDITLLHSFKDNFKDSSGHGTALSSVISGKTCGMTDAALSIVKIFDKAHNTMQSDFIAAFDAIWDDYLAGGNRASVINLSWSIAKNDYLESKILKLISAGMHVVCSAGNSGAPIGSVTPASMPQVITIGAYGEDFMPSDFSDYTSSISLTQDATNGGKLDGWAPGEHIRSALVGGGYGLVSGTSIAAAIHSSSIAYNLVDLVVGDNIIAPCYAAQTEVITRHVLEAGFFRRNMLKLSNVYLESENLITTFQTHAEDMLVPSTATFKIRMSQEMCMNMVSGVNVANVSSDKDLPDGLYLDNGILLGKFKSVKGDWENIEINFTLTLRNGTQTPYNISIWLLADNYDEMADPTPTVDVNIPYLMGAVCGFTGCDALGCSTRSCRNCSGDAKNPECACSNQECR
jgi:hypothetical protein